MILKSYETNKIKLGSNQHLLFYGKNDGLKDETIQNLFKNKKKINKYEEKEVLTNTEKFIENLFTKSLFEDERIILIKRSTEKIFKIIEEIFEKDLDSVTIIIESENLDKKSKLRNYFEKSKKDIAIAFYPDNELTLSKLAYNFFNIKKISISQSNINLIVNKCNGDRKNLMNELKKIEFYTKNGKKITQENIAKLANLSENHSVSELIDNCLAKNKKKTIYILNENNYTNEDCILILRTFLSKSKKILKLSYEYKNNKDINSIISSAKPPIFWKDKEITKQQLLNWNPEDLKELIYKVNTIELIVKKNINNSVNLISNFLLEQSSLKTNS